MALLSSLVALVAVALSVLLLVVAIGSAGKPSRVRPWFEWARIVAMGVTVLTLGVVAGVRTPWVAVLVCVAAGATLGAYQGRRTRFEVRGNQLWSRRPVAGLVVLAAGLIVTQLAVLARSASTFELGQSVGILALAISVGDQVGRRWSPKPPRRPVAATTLALALVGPLLVQYGPTAATAQVELLTGEIQVTLVWTGAADLDLWVSEPDGGSTVYYSEPRGMLGGRLDVDNNRACQGEGSFVENVAWPDGTPTGRFAVWVNHFECTNPTPRQSFRLEVRAGGNLELVDTGDVEYGAD